MTGAAVWQGRNHMVTVHSSRGFRLVLLGIASIVVSAGVCWWRDTGYAGPHHDEVVSLLASKGLERGLGRVLERGEAPLGLVAPAGEWQRFTKGFAPLPWSEIRRDVQVGDKHPPLAFWVFNRWLSLFSHGGYRQAVWLTWLQIVLAASVLAVTVYRFSCSCGLATLGLALFLLGNSAVFTATWVRQYALFAVIYALTMLLAAELARQRLSLQRFVVLAVLLGLTCVAGMSTQYTYATMSVPIHMALLVALAGRKDWSRTLGLCAVYVGGAVLFLLLNPGAIQHARAVSQSIDGRPQVGEALGGIAQMLIPWPSLVPAWVCRGVGAGAIGAIMALGAYVAWRMGQTGQRAWAKCPRVARICTRGESALPNSAPQAHDTERCAAGAVAGAVALAGMLGAGLLQVVLVALGFYLGWATGPNHLCAFWLLTVLAWTLFLHLSPQRWLRVLTAVGLAGMLGMQLLYGWHCHRIKPRTSVQQAMSLRTDLVVLDRLARGFILEVTDVLPPSQPVLIAASASIVERVQSEGLEGYRRVLYLPAEESVRQGEPLVTAAFGAAGWDVMELPVVHRGFYDAVLLTR